MQGHFGTKKLMLPHTTQSRLNICNEEQSLTQGKDHDIQAEAKHEKAMQAQITRNRHLLMGEDIS